MNTFIIYLHFQSLTPANWAISIMSLAMNNVICTNNAKYFDWQPNGNWTLQGLHSMSPLIEAIIRKLLHLPLTKLFDMWMLLSLAFLGNAKSIPRSQEKREVWGEGRKEARESIEGWVALESWTSWPAQPPYGLDRPSEGGPRGWMDIQSF